MRIFRVEHIVEGFGPLCSKGCQFHGFDWNSVFDFHFGVNEFADFDEKMPDGIQEHHFFGYSSCEKLTKMLHMKETLDDMGFVLAVYETDDFVLFQDGQVVFEKEKAKLISYHELI